jgi:hypothetical protein
MTPTIPYVCVYVIYIYKTWLFCGAVENVVTRTKKTKTQTRPHGRCCFLDDVEIIRLKKQNLDNISAATFIFIDSE